MAIPPLYDAHCHVNATHRTTDQLGALLPLLETLPPGSVGLMSTSHLDAPVVAHLAAATDTVVPCFGIHPWLSHLYAFHEDKTLHYTSVLSPTPTQAFIDALPEPLGIEKLMVQLETWLTNHPGSLVGEIGLDKLFRLPWSGYFGSGAPAPPSSEGQGPFSPYRVTMSHQREVFHQQLCLAARLRKPVSVHCVKAHGAVYDTVTQTPEVVGGLPAVCFHSYSGSLDHANVWVRFAQTHQLDVYFSFSELFNGSRAAAHKLLGPVVAALPPGCLLIETDLLLTRLVVPPRAETVAKTAVPRDNPLPLCLPDYEAHLALIFRSLCSARGWSVEEGAHHLTSNWRRFKTTPDS